VAKELPSEPEWRGVSGLRIVIPHGRPDVMLVEIKTLYGPVRLSMPRSIALKVGRSIAEEAEKLAPDRSLSQRMERMPLHESRKPASESGFCGLPMRADLRKQAGLKIRTATSTP